MQSAGIGFMEPDGDGTSGIMLMGEALGQTEAVQGLPFVGRAGHLLNKALNRVGIDRRQLTIINAAWCQPPGNRVPSAAEVSHCRMAHWETVIRERKPRVIVALGKVPTLALTGLTDDVEVLRGYPVRNHTLGAWVIPTYHPAFILRGNYYLEPFLHFDFQRAQEIAEKGYRPVWGRYVLDPSPETALAWARSRTGPILSFDIETNRKTGRVTRIGFCDEPFTGMSVPYSTEYLGPIRELLYSPMDKIAWNKAFDVGVLKERGGIEVQGEIQDTMFMWHVLHTDLPKGLDVVASVVCPEQARWAHLDKTQPALYNAVDADVTLRIHLKVREELRAVGRWEVYERHVVRLDRRLSLMSKAGMPVDRERHEAAAKQVTEAHEALRQEFEAVIPEAIRPVHPKVGYKREPKDTAGMVRREFQTDDGPVERWAKLEPLKMSPKLILAYQRHVKHPVAKRRVKGQVPKDTTEGVAILRARLKYPEDPVYDRLLRLRKLGQLKGVLGEWTPKGISGGMPVGPDGRVHTTFNHNPSTLRIATNNPTLQNLPRPSDDWSRLVRGMFVAGEGMDFLARDFSGIEAVLTGYFAGSRTMTYLALIDPHTYNTAYWLHSQGLLSAGELPEPHWSRDRLVEHLGGLRARFKKERQGVKTQTHAINYLAKPRQVQEILLTELEWVVDLKSVKAFFHFYRELYPELAMFHSNLVSSVEGIEEHELRGLKTGVHWIQNPFGYLHFFFRCVEWTRVGGEWQWGFGPTATDLAAFPAQSTAAAIAKESILRLEVDYPDIADGLRLFLHDELLGEWPMDRAGEVQSALRTIMERPIPELPLPPEWELGEHLVILTEGKTGHSWGDMRTYED